MTTDTRGCSDQGIEASLPTSPVLSARHVYSDSPAGQPELHYWYCDEDRSGLNHLPDSSRHSPSLKAYSQNLMGKSITLEPAIRDERASSALVSEAPAKAREAHAALLSKATFGAVFSISSSVVSRVLTLVGTLILMRRIGIAEYGEISVATTLV